MQIRHILPNASSRSTVSGERAFFLRNQVGSTLSFYTTRQTRYEGWFLQEGDWFAKLIERIEVVDAGELEAMTNFGTSWVWQHKSGLDVSWNLAPQHIGMTLACNRPAAFRITLDMRGLYSHPEFGRQYDTSVDSTGVTVRYSDTELAAPLYLHIRCRQPLSLTKNWAEQYYPRDTFRHSNPDRLYVFELGTITSERVSFGAGRSAAEASAASLAASKQDVEQPGIGISHSHDTLLTQTVAARATVTQSLRWLETQNGLYAGLPWFHQVWSRDELITAIGLTREEQHDIIERYLGLPIVEGELPTYAGSGSTCADGLGWLCLVARECGEHLLPEETQQRLRHRLEEAYAQLHQYRMASHGLIHSGHNATWMDTIGREGFRLEIQCMFALLLDLLHTLSGEAKYDQERLRLLGKIRQYYWNGTTLADGLDDPTIRPNLFLAYLLQPELLREEQWIQCFETALSALSCSWGGLASVDRQNPAFLGFTTGEDNRSYHNGDSWFFVNNLAAVAMHRLNARRFGRTVIDILQGSTDEILWHNMVGMPGEISSAYELDSYGCGLQAFSGGTYLALLNQLETYSGQALDSNAFFWGSTAASS